MKDPTPQPDKPKESACYSFGGGNMTLREIARLQKTRRRQEAQVVTSAKTGESRPLTASR
jgi:hypothetical protein